MVNKNPDLPVFTLPKVNTQSIGLYIVADIFLIRPTIIINRLLYFILFYVYGIYVINVKSVLTKR